MIKLPWVLDSYALEHIATLPSDQTQYGWATFQHYYYNSYKVPCVAAFLIWGLFLALCLTSGLSAFVERFYPCHHHSISKRATWWRGHISEHPLVSQTHSQTVSCGKGRFSWLTLHLPLRLEAIILVVMVILNIVPVITFYSLYVGHNTYFTGTDTVSRRSQILRHMANRCAMLGIAQLPMLILLSSKRTPIALLSQLSMNTMILYHRWIARMCYLHIVVHTLGNFLFFHFSIGVAKGLKSPAVQWGIAAIVILSGLVFLSLRALRNKHYEVFVFLHISMAVLAIFVIYQHIKLLHQGRLGLQIFVIELTAAFYAFDRIVRLLGRVIMSFSWRYADGAGATRKAELTSYGGGAYTRVRIQVPTSRLRLPPAPSPASSSSYFDLESGDKHHSAKSLRSHSVLGAARIGPGDDIRITIPKLQWVGDHPFSVFAAGRCKSGSPDLGYVDLVVQRQTGVTRKLSELAQQFSLTAINDERRQSDGYLPQAVRSKGKRVRVVIDGPFGRSPSLEGAQHAVLIAGGIAITFCYPLLVRAARGEFSSLESCKLVWLVRNESILDVLRESLSEVLDELRHRRGGRCGLSIDIYVTSSAESPAITLPELFMDEERRRLPSRLEPTWNAFSGRNTERSSLSSSTLVDFAETSAESSRKPSISSISVDRPEPVHGQLRMKPEEVLFLDGRSHRAANDGANDPKSLYSDLPSSSPYTHTYQLASSTSSNISLSKLHPLYTGSSYSSVDKADCTLQSESSPSSYPSPTRAPDGRNELERGQVGPQDVLSETRSGSLIEIRRFRGRPSTMAAFHRHITQQADRGAPVGRIVFATCGPARMCDSVRAEVVALLKKGIDAALVEDCFNW